ncbi:MAG: hypothetical protein JWQ78_2223, partial [Sediminibacterium sp.]|nr:hypothetical protein [Sediminibacterium sp.]
MTVDKLHELFSVTNPDSSYKTTLAMRKIA